MSLLFSKRAAGNPFPEPIVPAWPGMAGGFTPDSAMRLDAVWACVRLLSDTVSMLPLHAMDSASNLAEPPTISTKQPAWMQNPFDDLSMSEWLRQQMIAALLRGNAYAFRIGSAGSPSLRFQPLNPDLVNVKMEQGERVYTVNGEVIPNDRMLHIRGYTMPGSVVGMSPIAYASTMLQTQASIDRFASGYFADAPHPAAVFQSDQPINPEQARQIKDRVMAAGTSREPLVMGLGLKMTTLAVSPEESQFLETQRYSVNRIARIFGVPPEMIGGSSGGGMTYANVTQRAMDFLTYSVQAWLSRFELAVGSVLPARQVARFDTRELVRMVPVDTAKVNTEYLKSGVLTINDVRLSLNMPTVAWGDEPYLPSFATASAMTIVQSEVQDETGDTND